MRGQRFLLLIVWLGAIYLLAREEPRQSYATGIYQTHTDSGMAGSDPLVEALALDSVCAVSAPLKVDSSSYTSKQ